MSANTPPDPYFNNINFNPSFFKVVSKYLTEAIANTKYLKLIGGTLSGFLGIGRTARVELDVNGKAVINNGTSSLPGNGTLGSDGTRLVLFEGSASATPYALGIDVNVLWYGTSSTGSHRFYTGSSERMFINNNGNVGIGTDTAHTAMTKLTIRGSSTGSTQPLVKIIQTATWDNGNYALDVEGYTNLGGFRINGADSGNSIYQLIQNSDFSFSQNPSNTTGGNMKFNVYGAAGNIIFYTSATNERMRINTSGNVGIGTNDPGTNKLYVNGDTTITGSLIINNSELYLTTSGSSLLGVATVAQEYSTSSSIGDTVLRAQATKRLMLQSGTAEPSITIDSTKYVNIGSGVISPAFPITISTSLTQSLSLSSYAIAGTSSYLGNQTTPITPNIMLGVLGTSAFNSSFYVYSDKRIKKDINPIENSLDIIEKLNPVIYKYIDFIEKGNLNNYGVIAQEVEHILPDIINKHKDFIPNIYKNVDSYDNESLVLSINTIDLSIGDSIKLYDANNNAYIRTIINIDGDKIKIDEKLDDYEDGTNIFLYGKEEKEVKNINYEALFTINLKATQELYKRLKKLEDIIKNISL